MQWSLSRDTLRITPSCRWRVCPEGTILKNPSEAALARALGMVRIDRADRTYDVAIIGVSPAGLSSAVYAAPEGRPVIAFEARALVGRLEPVRVSSTTLPFQPGVRGRSSPRVFVQEQKF
jgi:thioredoxin reductase (NADPH)